MNNHDAKRIHDWVHGLRALLIITVLLVAPGVSRAELPTVSAVAELTASRSHRGDTASAHLRIYRQPGERKGIWVRVDGFNPEALEPAEIADFAAEPGTKMLEARFEEIWDLGYDYYEVIWHDGATWIERNAVVLRDLLEAIAAGTVTPSGQPAEAALAADEALVVFGESMGGLVSRYALLEMENDGVDHQVDLWMTNDSPLNGAYVPIGLQYAANYLDGVGSYFEFDVPEAATAHDLPAAQQMVIFHHSRANTATTPSYSTEYEALFSQIESLGGWPSAPGLRKVALASGRGDGVVERVYPPGAATDEIMQWRNVVDTSSTPVINNALIRQHNPTAADALDFVGCVVNIPVPITVRVQVIVRVFGTHPSSSPQTVFRGSWRDDAFLDGQLANENHAIYKSYIRARLPGCVPTFPVDFRDPIADLAATFVVNEVRQRRADATKDIPAGYKLQDIEVQASEWWEFVPGGLTNRIRAAADALDPYGIVLFAIEKDCFIPTGSALGFWKPSIANNVVPPIAADEPVDTIDPSMIPFEAVHVYQENEDHLLLDDSFQRILGDEAARALGLVVISSLAPSWAHVAPHAADLEVEISGGDFLAGDRAVLDGRLLATTFHDVSTLRATIPGWMLARGPESVPLRIERGGEELEASATFEFVLFEVRYDPTATDPDPVAQGWLPTEINPGQDTSPADGLIDPPGNSGPIGDPTIAWQIYDRNTASEFNGPGYHLPLSDAEQTDLIERGWTFAAEVRIARHSDDANFDCFTGWGLSIPFEGSSPPHRIGFYVGDDGTGAFSVRDDAGTVVTLGPGTAGEFHTITARGVPGTSTYEWFVDGVSGGVLDFTDDTIVGLTAGAVSFQAGSSAQVLAASDWKSVSLTAWPSDRRDFHANYPELDAGGDENGDGFTNYHNYAAGTDPFAPYDASTGASLLRNESGDFLLRHTRRLDVVDAIVEYNKSADLQEWLPMIENTDYAIESIVPLAPDREEVTIRLLFDPAVDPRMFVRQGFDSE